MAEMDAAEAALLESLQASPMTSTVSSELLSTSSDYGTDSTASTSPNSPVAIHNDKAQADGLDLGDEYGDDEDDFGKVPRILVIGHQHHHQGKPVRKLKFRLRPPYLMILVSVLEIAVYCLSNGAAVHDWLVYDPRRRVQGWRFISYMLLHSDALHLGLNVAIQLVLATPLEVEQGRLAVGTIYLGGGLCGALSSSLLQPTSYLVGASAGVYALLTSHLAHLYLRHGELRYAGWRLAAVFLLVGSDVASLPVPELLGCGQVGWAAHAAGALAGPLLGLAVFPKQSKRDSRGRSFVRFVRLVSGVGVLLLVVGAVLGNAYLVALPQLRRPS